MGSCEATFKFRLQLGRSNQPVNIARLIAMLQYSREQNIRFDCDSDINYLYEPDVSI